MTDYRIRFEISLTGEQRTALVPAKTPGEAVQLVLADHGAICLLHLEELPLARGVSPLSMTTRPKPWHDAQEAYVSRIAAIAEHMDDYQLGNL